MQKLKIIATGILFFIFGSGTSVYFVSNVQANKFKHKLLLDRAKIQFDPSGLSGVNAFHAYINENEVIAKAWPGYKDKLTPILQEGLKKEGLRIVQGADEPIPDFLALTFNAVRDEASGTIAGSAELSLNGVFMDFDGKRYVPADRWDKTQAFMAKEAEAPEYLERIARSMIDDFLKDYAAANPKEGTRQE